jgi:hypothetical protein
MCSVEQATRCHEIRCNLREAREFTLDLTTRELPVQRLCSVVAAVCQLTKCIQLTECRHTINGDGSQTNGMGGHSEWREDP